ncbi:hypothetical protein BU26DRAFT_128928 [Trematosphaeria pertusa]|uniref:Diphthamide biosynthesis protein 4 n=1 Tax=Trematosphaeria pertusa TaxID=390896 RepID=A0A6A6HWY2_9PLEO|nr:uncharacterized protein BU26DRAFT_128928 [Trematosphaeria pertusa]KAF2242586.1 hypothetical protein BU26DRAFT_128928 [Trematosphaeria pertusa]
MVQMLYTQNYYSVLGLASPTLRSSSSDNNASASLSASLSPTAIRRAYKTALLSAHPDKAAQGSTVAGQMHTQHVVGGGVETRGAARPERSAEGTGKGTHTYTVDDVKQAFSVLGDAARKREYDRWLAAQPLHGSRGDGSGSGMGRDFVLGLEVLDLSDFEVVARDCSSEEGGTPTSFSGEGDDEVQWVRPCRCGAEKGFRISEGELVDVERRGGREVLVGCEGCSLWVRVGFEVEVEER